MSSSKPPAISIIVERARSSLHDRFGWHTPNHSHAHWDEGAFVTECSICQKQMIKQPGAPWRLRHAG